MLVLVVNLYNDYSIAKIKKQTYIPKICSIFGLTSEYMFDIIQTQRTNVPEHVFLYEVKCVMRVQKSVYYMTDRELRIYKRQLRRRRQLQRRIVTMLATICVIAFCAVSYHGIRSLASSGEDQLKFKYYTQVTVAYGETLWDLSDDYIDYDEYKDKKEYIAEVQSINHLTEEDSIRAGQTLIVPYYSYDFVK